MSIMEGTGKYAELVAGIKELGFLGSRYHLEDPALCGDEWSKKRFFMPAQGDLPERILFVRQHSIYGTTLAIWPIPILEDGIYHYSTSDPVSQERALELLRGYVEVTAEGRKYVPE